MITTSSPIQTSPSSAVSTAPCSTRVRSPSVIAPQRTADGATYPDAGITGRSPRWVRIMIMSVAMEAAHPLSANEDGFVRLFLGRLISPRRKSS
jgi:hypothetical protein